ncbi:MAG: helix-turn-helix transcriptional regulator [Opitutaceae bacterium]|nr:helix-turn-helix transcriptional regulator [Opitutaceae bacterium]
MFFKWTPEQVKAKISERVQKCRLELNLSRQGLADRSGVAFSTLRIFEREGKISLENLLKLAAALGELEAFSQLFTLKKEDISSLDELLEADQQRQRGRRK